ncbi:hypothetical protein CRUP_023253 [Coryphaenoides rupestris]|nr:hypothetical protein CRUP_023253 [Coryphaenoides rupestris]
MDSCPSALNRSQSMTSGLEKASPSCNKPCHSRSSSTASSRHSRQTGSDRAQDMTPPGVCEGYLLKRRKWPLKGWHKISRGRVQGSLDVSVAVMSINKKTYRMDLDTGDFLYHVKAKSHELFYIWVTKLQAHRAFKKKHEATAAAAAAAAAHVHNGFLLPQTLGPPVGSARRNGDLSSPGLYSGHEAGPSEVPPPAATNTGVNGKVSAWLQQSHNPDSCVQELNRCQLDVSELSRLSQRLQALETSQPITNGDLQRIISIQNLCLEKPKSKSKSCRMWGQSRTMSRVEALGMLSSSHLNSSSSSASVASIPDYVCSQLSPLPTAVSAEGRRVQQDFCTVSLRVLASLKAVHDALSHERQRLQDAWGSNTQSSQPSSLPEAGGGGAVVGVRPSSRAPSPCDSADEYFDASDDVVCGGSSSEVSDESGLSEGTTSNSEPEEGHGGCSRSAACRLNQGVCERNASETCKYQASISQAPCSAAPPKRSGRRTTLPAHCPDNSHVGLMAILYNNIGKDLSRVSMPAPLNEPINLLQRLCEELEYSELLDTANRTPDPYQRMVRPAWRHHGPQATHHHHHHHHHHHT